MQTPHSRRTSTATRLIAAPAVAALVIALLPLGPTQPAAARAMVTRSAASTTATGAATGHLIAFNDFHGNIDPPTGGSGLVNGDPAGGIEYLATYVKRLRADALRQTRDVYTVAAGDLVGASPLVSAAFHDEPTIEEMNALGLQISSVGNHEFDEGTDELKRLQRGGCHPTDGCADGDGFTGSAFRYLAANVTENRTGLPILLPLDIRFVGGVPVAVVGMTLEGTPGIVNPAGVRTVTFHNEVTTANRYADLLGRIGVHAMVLLLHQGGSQQPAPSAVLDVSGCANFSGDITGIVAGLRPEYGIVVSGHTHRPYVCGLPNSSGANSLVTSAGSFGTLVTDVSFTVDRRTRRIASATARNQVVLNGVRNATGGWQRDANGNFVRNPDLVDQPAKAIADKYRIAVAPLANRVVGSITADISNVADAAGESPLGDVIADGMLAYTRAAQAQIALMNPGGIRASLSHDASPGGEAPGQVTYGECFTVQPFNNLVVTLSYTGAQLKEVLEEQFSGHAGQTSTKFLQVSAGFGYTYDATRPLGQRITAITLDGQPIDPSRTYRVAMNDFLANGGDGFSGLKVGTERVTAPGFDVDALVAYLGTGPIGPGPQDRITMIG
jgi:5'-nucleotidase